MKTFLKVLLLAALLIVAVKLSPVIFFMAFIGLTNANMSLLFWGFAIAAWPAYKTFRIFEARKHRGILEGYITEVCQQGPAR